MGEGGQCIYELNQNFSAPFFYFIYYFIYYYYYDYLQNAFLVLDFFFGWWSRFCVDNRTQVKMTKIKMKSKKNSTKRLRFKMNLLSKRNIERGL